MEKSDHPANGNVLRAQIFEVLSKSKTPEDGWVTILSQCTAQVRNKTIVKRIARECDLTLSGFRSDTTLELYFDISRGQQEMGYISKGWDDPGFRIGELIDATKSKTVTLLANALQVMKICATNGIGVSVHDTADSIELHLDGVIYSEGFNRETFMKTLDTLRECVKEVRALIGVGGEPRRPKRSLRRPGARACSAEMASIDTLNASAFGRMPDVDAATMRIVALARDALGRP